VRQLLIKVASFHILLRLLNMTKELYLAWTYGVSPEMDAFVFTWGFPMFLGGLLSSAILSALIPAWIGLKRKSDHQTLERRFQTLYFIVLVCCGVLAILYWIFGPVLIIHFFKNHSQAVTELALGFVKTAAISTLLFSILGYLYSILNAEKYLGLVSSLPFIRTVVVVPVVYFFHATYGVSALLYGSFLGLIAEIIVLSIIIFARLGFRPFPLAAYPDRFAIEIGRDSYPVIVASVTTSSVVLVDQTMSAVLEAGSVSALTYASKIPDAVLGLGVSVIQTVIFSHISTLSADMDLLTKKTWFRQLTWKTFGLCSALTVVLWLLGPLFVSVLFSHGKLGHGDAVRVSQVQSLLLLQIPFALTGSVLVRMLNVMRMNQFLIWIGFLSFLTNIFGNWYFMKTMGLQGIALSTLLVSVVSTVSVYFALETAFHRQKVAR
jgi:putative peptidoglycan lipid II flippase